MCVRKKWVRGAAPRFFLDDLGQFLEFFWSLKTEFLEIGNFRLGVIEFCISSREIKIEVWKYIHPILMGLGAVLGEKLDNQDRALRPWRQNMPPEARI